MTYRYFVSYAHVQGFGHCIFESQFDWNNADTAQEVNQWIQEVQSQIEQQDEVRGVIIMNVQKLYRKEENYNGSEFIQS